MSLHEYIHDFDFGAGADKVYHFKEGYPGKYIEFIRIIFREVLRKVDNYEGLNHSYIDTLPMLAYSLYDVVGGLKWFNIIVKKVIETNHGYLKKVFHNMLRKKGIEM